MKNIKKLFIRSGEFNQEGNLRPSFPVELTLPNFSFALTVWFFFPILLFLLSCGSAGAKSSTFIGETVRGCIGMIGKDLPEGFTFITESRYVKQIQDNGKNPADVSIELEFQSGIAESCRLVFSPLNVEEEKLCYAQILQFLENENWELKKPSLGFEIRNGELYKKKEMYLELNEGPGPEITLYFSKNISYFVSSEEEPIMIYDIDYYKSKIIEYRNFFDDRQKISYIIKIEKIIPGSLCFLVCWDDNLKGFIYELYAFKKDQSVGSKYLVGYGPKLNNYRNALMEKIPGINIEEELLSFGDFNNDGLMEIASYSLYPNIGYVFTLFGFSFLENDLVNICQAPVFINFDRQFPPVEYTERGFKILEVMDDAPLELAWNNYIWDAGKGKYERN